MGESVDPIEEIIEAVAVKHGIALGRDDPILILHTINERLMRDSAAAQERILSAYKSELELLADRWGLDARKMAERTLTAALTASKEEMDRALRAAAVAMAAPLRAEVEEALGRVRPVLEETRSTMRLHVAASCCSLAAAVIAGGVVLFR